jgi:hypothetical protein
MARKKIKERGEVSPDSAMEEAGESKAEEAAEDAATKKDNAKAKPKKVGGK